MSERLYCCVDGGASNTRVALYDESGHRLGLTVTGPTSLTVRGTDAWSDILDALESAWMEVVEEESEKDADFARVWAALSEFRANYKIWGDLGYLD